MKKKSVNNNQSRIDGEEPLSDWMSKLSDEKKNVPISKLAIPGSHDSFTYSLCKTTPVGPDEPNWMRRISKIFGRATKSIIYRWAKCQRANCRQQLELGIRYFDIRLAKFSPKKGEAENGPRSFRVVHGLYGDEIESILSDINAFLESQKGEIVILDFQHIFDFQKDDHLYLVSLLKTTFGPKKMCPMPKDGIMVSLKEMLDVGQRLVVIYPSAAGMESFLWPRQYCPNPWPNTMKLEILTDYLNQGLEGRDHNWLFVSQGILTPTVGTVVLHPFSTLEKTVCRPCNNFLETWIKSKEVWEKTPNIVICDYPENNSLSKSIVEINFK